jgi:hypothetical protein
MGGAANSFEAFRSDGLIAPRAHGAQSLDYVSMLFIGWIAPGNDFISAQGAGRIGHKRVYARLRRAMA